jgi:hypothetical protein
MLRRYLRFAIIGVTSVLPAIAAAQQNDASWKNLNQLTHRASFIFATKERDCVAGSLKSITDKSVTVKLWNGKTKTFQRTDLLRVTYGEWARGVLFSSRSSWLDVSTLASKHRTPTKVLVETKAGQKQEGDLVTVSDNALTLQFDNKTFDVSKAEIADVSYIIPKPLSDSAMYADHELVFMKIFDPEL